MHDGLGYERRKPAGALTEHPSLQASLQEFRAKTAEILKAEEALPGTEEEAEAGAGLAAPVVAGTAGARAAEVGARAH